MNIHDLLKKSIELGASDIHITINSTPIARVKGSFVNLSETVLTKEHTQAMTREIAGEKNFKRIEEDGECDFSVSIESGERFRVNAYKQKGNFAIAIRTITSHIPDFDTLGLPEVLKNFAEKHKGLVLVTGPTGSGKSTTLASLINIINENQQRHIITLEDPIEYVHDHKQSLVNQREIGQDTESFNSALRAILRQDPDVILVGEMRDPETISIALTAAETGHLVFSTLHTVGAAKTIDRIVDMFPSEQQQQVRTQLSTVCEGVVSQQLIKTIDGRKRVAALEVMVANPAIRNLIRENKTYQIQNIIQTGSKQGMQSMDQELVNLYRRGLISNEERYERVIETWTETTEKVTDALMANLDRLNNIFIMAHSGARGSKNQIRQLAGMRGLMANASGKTVEIPVKSNFREGLSVLEYFTSSHGARKGLADTALRTADSGYLTRRLVDVSQDVIVRDVDCGTTEDTEIFAIKDGNEVIEVLYDRIVGRYTIDPIVNPTTGEVIVEADSMIKEDEAEKIIAAGIETVQIRTVLNCKTNHGVCSKCYGRNLATGKEVNIGEAVGIIAAQSIGEPGTQLTMRTFHTGGVAGGDITQGLPRVEELFEARKPKGLATITEVSGRVEIDETGKRKEVTVVPEQGETQVYAIPYGSRLRVKNGQFVEAGEALTQGSINPHDIVRVKGIEGVQDYVVKEVQRVYRMQGVDVNDKHIEVIVRQMLSKVKVEDPGDTELIPGGYEDVLTFDKCNEEAIAQGLKPAVAKRVLLGITKASLATESFLSAASFQETTRVLTEAAIKGKEDHLIGLKENVIIGKLIPAGTGMKRYKNIAVEKIQD